MKKTLLELVQDILSGLDSDEVNSISDTVESMQVARIIRRVYFDIVTRAGMPEHYGLANLEASNDTDLPVVMYVPDHVVKLEWVKYNKATATDTSFQMKPVQYLLLSDFLDLVYGFDATDTNVASYDLTSGPDTYTLQYKTDIAPSYYTSFDDRTLVFDSVDTGVETTLQSSKTTIYGRKVPAFQMSNSFVPDLDDLQFSLLANEAHSLAWTELKQSSNIKTERNAVRGWTQLQQSKFRATTPDPLDTVPNYGRR
jgi:hypothetical protein